MLHQVIYPVTIDYGQSFEQMIAAGRYDSSNQLISPSVFPISGTGQSSINVELFHPNLRLGTDDILRVVDGLGLRPVRIEELLALGAAHPPLQIEFPIIELGTLWRTGEAKFCVSLRSYGRLRDLCLNVVGDDWHTFCRFAVTRKEG